MEKWIWYPCEFEIWLSEKISVGRRERGRVYPVFWRLDSACKSAMFSKKFMLEEPLKATIEVQGEYYASLDGQIMYQDFKDVIIPAGEHQLSLAVYNPKSFPAIFCADGELRTNSSWQASLDGRNHIPVASGNFDCSDKRPENFALEQTPLTPIIVKRESDYIFADFGKEVMGYPVICSDKPGSAVVYYGESEQEALDFENCEFLDSVELKEGENILLESRAMRYMTLTGCDIDDIQSLSLLYEYAPLTQSGSFNCSDDLINQIWEISRYTLQLNSREFLLDGIKRDRWVWMGDVCQSALMSYYTFTESEIPRRSLIAVRGKDPVTTYINHIMDYSFYWFIGLSDYVRYTGDTEIVPLLYDRMVSMMDFCLSRVNSDNFIEGRDNDWIFIDWADIDNRGEVCPEQILFEKSLQIMADFAERMGDNLRAKQYRSKCECVNKRIVEVFFDAENHQLYHNRFEGNVGKKVSKHAAILAIKCGLFDEDEKKRLAESTLKNDDIPQITTPYMKLYELEALCETGERQMVIQYLRSYWGGMLALGATTFWEQYDPNESVEEHLAMYGRKYARSLCHAWGAGPLYLLGRYFLGVRPLADGYSVYEIAPDKADFTFIEGDVPVPWGKIHVRLDDSLLIVTGARSGGKIRLKCAAAPIISGGLLLSCHGGEYIIEITDEQLCRAEF